MKGKSLRLVIALIVPLVLASFADAAEEGLKRYTCPVCENAFEAPAHSDVSFEMEFCDAKSMDSDFCYYGEKGSPLFQMVVSCPKCLYSAYGREFSRTLPDGQKEEVRSMLKEHPLPPSVKPDAIPPWLKWQYAARCYRIRRTDILVAGTSQTDILFAGQAFHGGAYCARIEATKEATDKLPLKDPGSVLPELEKLEKDIASEKDSQRKSGLMLLAAQAAQRGGFVELRDKWVSRLKEEAAGNQAVQQQLERFTGLAAAEEQCLEQALECYRTAMYEEKIPYRNRTLYSYIIADIMRRLGRHRSPVVRYYARVIEDDQARPDLKKLANYFIEYLSRI